VRESAPEMGSTCELAGGGGGVILIEEGPPLQHRLHSGRLAQRGSNLHRNPTSVSSRFTHAKQQNVCRSCVFESTQPSVG
jgi:hypothetical protein